TTTPPPKRYAEQPPAPANHYTDRCSQVRNFGEHTWGLSMSAITCVSPPLAATGNPPAQRAAQLLDRATRQAEFDPPCHGAGIHIHPKMMVCNIFRCKCCRVGATGTVSMSSVH
ncbi:hypothetical protein, partial [Mycobacteroides abscessus]|uniref:hypothetical protein n=1 Tax=Mycobacteroides abscessus TaxID=36809 RepID=UPI001A99F6A2